LEIRFVATFVLKVLHQPFISFIFSHVLWLREANSPPLHYCITRRQLKNMFAETYAVQHCPNIFHLTAFHYRRKHIVADTVRLHRCKSNHTV